MSLDVKMAWRNVWRHPRRTILTITAIAFACVLLIFMVSWQFGSYEVMLNSTIKMTTGHLQIQAQGYREKKDMRQVVPNPGELSVLLDKIPRVQAYTFRANAFSLVSSRERTYGVIAIGIAPAREAAVSTLKNIIRQGHYLSESDTYQALVGELLAKNLHVAPGDDLTVLGQGRDGSVAAAVVKVKGIYASGVDEFDRSSVYIPLKTFQEVYGMQGAVHEVVINTVSLSEVSKIKSIIAANLQTLNQKQSLEPVRKPRSAGVYPRQFGGGQAPALRSDRLLVVLDWDELTPRLLQGIKLDLTFGVLMYIFLILVVAFSILNTFLMAIFERTKEFGVLMALGIRPGRLTKLLIIESMAMTAIGIIIGIIAGSLFTLYFQIHGFVIEGMSEMLKQYSLPERIHPQLSWLSVVIGPGVVFVITFLAALYPALKIRGLQPVKALTHT